jgi:hypothetical protein
MRWDHLPSRDDFLEMLVKARRNTADAVAEAKRTCNVALLLDYQLQLADWDRLIKRMLTP